MPLERLFKGWRNPEPTDDPPANPAAQPLYHHGDTVEILGGFFRGQVGRVIEVHYYPQADDRYLFRVCILPDAYCPLVWQGDIKVFSKVEKP